MLKALVAGCALLAASMVPGPVVAAPSATSDYSSGTYVVVLSQSPAASYLGGVHDLARTAPRAGARFDASSPASRLYTRFLRARQDAAARSVGVEPFYHYTTSLNGFAAALTAAQARSLSRVHGVLAVVPDRVRHTQGWSSAEAGATAAQAISSPRHGPTGAGVVIGVVDTGIDSGSRSFSPLADLPGPSSPGTYTGSCRPSADTDTDAAFRCSDKLVGGAYFLRGQGGPHALWSGEYLSPEDFQGHGTRTASTAAGNARARAVGRGIDLGRVVGAAPDARLASYKVCWAAEDGTDSCLTSDALAGIDRAVSDGVDVLSYGAAGTSADLVDPVELAFLHAAAAGVFVAAAAGNDGPQAGSVGHPSPWATTVGASTEEPRVATVVLGNSERYVGLSASADDVAEAPLVPAADAAVAGSDKSDARLCFPGSLDPAAVSGAIVVCDRGTNDRVEKSAVVDAAGGVGMVLLNPGAESLHPDLHAVPTVHLPDTAYDGVYAYAENADHATAAIRAGVGRLLPGPPGVAEFSGRGPSRAAGGDLLKPDLVAPGVDVLTAASDGYDLSSGTSVAAAYVAGLAARLEQAHPGWSPMAVKSALMTTGHNRADSDPFDRGAGSVDPQRALDPGLVLESGLSDWTSYLAGEVRAANVNVGSVVVDDMAGRATVQRTVTNVGGATSTYAVSSAGIDGISVTAVPSVFTLGPGERQTVTLRFVRDSAALGRYETGEVRLRDGPGGHVVQLPVALRPVGVRAPRWVRLHGQHRSLSTRSGIRGTLVARVRGPVAGVDTAADGSDTDGADFVPGLSGLWSQTVDVAGPREWLRVEALADHPEDDLDLFVLDRDGQVVSSSATDAASEALTVRGLEAGTYTIDVQPWFVADPSGETTFTVRTFQVPRRPSGSLTIEPRHQGASPARVNAWSVHTSDAASDAATDAAAGTSRFGWIGWYAGDRRVGRTLVSSD